MKQKKAVYPGTFDPITNGHVNIVERAAAIFDDVIVAVAVNSTKKPVFGVREREHLARVSLSHLDNVRVSHFDNLLVEFCSKNNADLILRGLRAVSDFEFEFQLAAMNRQLNPLIETFFLTPSEQFSFVSSTLVREVSSLGGDVSTLVPDVVAKSLLSYFGEKE